MRKDQICEMLWTMGAMVSGVYEGHNYTEVSTFVKNHVSGIEPEYVEVFRDFIYQLQGTLAKKKENQ